MTKTISEQWQDFQKAVMPTNAPPIQVIEMRRAFFAGFTGCLATLSDLPDTMSEDEGAARLDRYAAEAPPSAPFHGAPASQLNNARGPGFPDNEGIVSKDGLLFRNGVYIPLPEADAVADRFGYTSAEQMVRAIAREK